jgi:2-polyprenyl-6-hydroxyphenyl methylase/3-demethylubiquinone-9 3-methyltransferase
MINNEFYKELGDKWYTAEGDAVALLRLEKKATNPWVIDRIRERYQSRPVKLLDIGCGGGLLIFDLNAQGWQCTGLDVSDGVLNVGRARDLKKEIAWVEGRAESLPFADQSFDVVCMMDVLEHIHEPKHALKEATRVLKPDGTLIFHTFNRTAMSWLFAAKGLDWFIRDSQSHIHDWNLFIDPKVLTKWLSEFGAVVECMDGVLPKIWSRPFFKLLLTRRVPANFEFKVGGPLSVGYLGCAQMMRRAAEKAPTH